MTFEDLALAALAKHGYSSEADPCYLQCFELSSLEKLSSKTKLKRIFLLKSKPKTNRETFERVKRAGIYGIGIDKLLLVEIQGSTDPNPGHIKQVHPELVQQVFIKSFHTSIYSGRTEGCPGPRHGVRSTHIYPIPAI